MQFTATAISDTTSESETTTPFVHPPQRLSLLDGISHRKRLSSPLIWSSPDFVHTQISLTGSRLHGPAASLARLANITHVATEEGSLCRKWGKTRSTVVTDARVGA